MVIGLFGFDFVSSNMGCEALTYSFLNMVSKASEKNIKFINFSYGDSLGSIPAAFSEFKFEVFKISLKDPRKFYALKKAVSRCDVFFDATFGDGFSDIYGKKWNIITDTIKTLVINSKVPLFLVPQTYGPFESAILRKWGMHIIKKATCAYSRDEYSSEYINKYGKTNIRTASDMAFKLPYDKALYRFEKNILNIGINISSLLWEGKWAQENHFGLKVDYKNYIFTLIDRLIEKGLYNVHLISHVINLDEPNHRENDYRICLQIKEKYGDKVILAPPFCSPIQAKSYIAQMDFFVGARMHATIAAISSGVATVPFSYSRKFEGLYYNLQYNYIVSARNINTEEALDHTFEWLSRISELKEAGKKASSIAVSKLDLFEKDVINALKNY